ncbi:MAG: MazG family protein, partial [Oscillospiraceae bacterium]|nr:MazG family protein [Oscillospiraceae bacterium]
MVSYPEKEHYDYNDLVAIMRILRAPGGCVWDREQTHESIRRDFLEEVYEVCEAIDENSPEHLCEELGDALLQVVFHADIAEEEGWFNQLDVCDGICRKLIYRHPHVFGDVSVSSSAEVLDNWDALKRKEKEQQTQTDALRAVAKTLPALWRAEKLQHKAAKAGVRQ